MRCRRRMTLKRVSRSLLLQVVFCIIILLLVVASVPDYILLPSTELEVNSLPSLQWCGLSYSYRKFMQSRNQTVTSLPDIVLEPTSQCEEQTFLVVLVLSPLEDRQTRDLIRETWGRAVKQRCWPRGETLKVSTEVFFILGMPRVADNATTPTSASLNNSNTNSNTAAAEASPLSQKSPNVAASSSFFSSSSSSSVTASELEKRIKQEALQHNDLIVGDFADTYLNLTRKTLTALQWAVKQCRSAKFIMKLDQDTLVDMSRLTDFLLRHTEVKEQGVHDLAHQPLHSRSDHLPSLTNTRPISDQPSVIKNAVIGNLVYNAFRFARDRPFLVYPTYAAGPCYLLTPEAAAKIVKAASSYPLLESEDLHVTGVLAAAAGVEKLHLRQLKFTQSGSNHPCMLVGRPGCKDGERQVGESEEGGGSRSNKDNEVHPRDSYYMSLTKLSRDKLREAWGVMTSDVCFQHRWNRPWISS